MICELPASAPHDKPYESCPQKAQHDFCVQEVDKSLAEESGRSMIVLTTKEYDCWSVGYTYPKHRKVWTKVKVCSRLEEIEE